MDSIKLFKNGALVTFDRNKASGFYTVLLRDPYGAVHDKVSCDTRGEALAYRRAFEKIAKNLALTDADDKPAPGGLWFAPWWRYLGETMPSMKQIRAMPQWVARSGASTLTVRAVDITQARERCAQIGMREPSSIVLKTDPAGDARAAAEAFERWHCAACGRLSSIGDKPVRNPCKCAELGD